MDEPGRRRRMRRNNPLTWRLSARVLLVVLVVLAGLGVFASNRLLTGEWLYFPAYIDPVVHQALDGLWMMGSAVWIAMALAALVCMRWVPESRVLVHVTIQLYAVTIATFVTMAGPFSAAGWMFFLAGAILGFLLFDRAAFFGLGTYLLLLVVGLVLGSIGVLGRLPYGTRPPGISEPEWLDLIWRTTLSSALFAAMVLFLCVYIVKLLRDRERKLEHLTKTDALTGVLNRGYFMRQMRAELARARRYRTPLACVMLDLDHFKAINDGHGHIAGDQVLERVGAVLAASVREHDLVGRYGGEEFVVLLPNTDVTGAHDVAERCRAVIEAQRISVGDVVLSVTASFGVAAHPDSEVDTVDGLLRQSDEALYRAKTGGRNRIEVVA